MSLEVDGGGAVKWCGPAVWALPVIHLDVQPHAGAPPDSCALCPPPIIKWLKNVIYGKDGKLRQCLWDNAADVP